MQATRVLALSAGVNSEFAGRLEMDGSVVKAHVLKDTGTGRNMVNHEAMTAAGFATHLASQPLIGNRLSERPRRVSEVVPSRGPKQQSPTLRRLLRFFKIDICIYIYIYL